MALFAERGVSGVTVRDIAVAAGVSAPLVIHHYKSKEGLKAAVDERAMDLLAEMFAGSVENQLDGEWLASMTTVFADLLERHPALTPYLRRMLVDGGPEAELLFRGLYEATRTALAGMRERGLIRASADEDVRAAFLLVNDLGAVILRDQVRAVLGIDPLRRPGIVRWGDTVTGVYAAGLVNAPREDT